MEHTCNYDGCYETIYSKSLCNKHYMRNYMRLRRNSTGKNASRVNVRNMIIDGNIIKIPLGKDAKDGYSITNIENFEIVNNRNWRRNAHGYAVTSLRGEDGRYKETYMHHLIIGKPMKGFVTDHRNRNRLDNTSSNLRHISYRLNSINRGISDGKELKGVTYCERDKNWRTSLTIDGFNNRKYFKTKEEAVPHYNNLVSMYYPDYGMQNILPATSTELKQKGLSWLKKKQQRRK